MHSTAPTAYRADIDGLRAVAVIAVMLFHLDVPGFEGGFVGVDVFFVISGFLITKLLLQEQAQGPGWMARFYARRILRIVPALVLVSLACAVAAYAVLLPSEAARLGESMAAAALFVANLYFMAQGGYANSLDMQAPLLHLWSLSVEEQFYLLYPCLLMALAAWLRRREAWVLAVLGVLSFFFAAALAQRSANAAFLFGPARAWELLLGGFVAAWRAPAFRRWQAEGCALAGLVLVVLGVSAYGSLPVPARAWLLLPCVGTALLVAAGSGPSRPLVTAALAWRPFIFVGLISYSLYLWHWPLIVSYRAVRPFQPGIEAFVLPASFALAVLSWHFVEKPLRRLQAPRRAIYAGGAMAMVVLVLAGALLVQGQGGAYRLPAHVRYLDAYNDYRDPDGIREGRCFLLPRHVDLALLDQEACLGSEKGKPTWLLVGDSHAAHLWNGLARALPHVHLQQATASACKPVLAATGNLNCDNFMLEFLGQAVPARRPAAIVLAARWSGTDPQLLRETVLALRRTTPRVIVLGPAIEYRDALPRLLALAQWHGDENLPERAKREGMERQDAQFAAALEGTGATYVSLQALMCPGGRCATTTEAGTPLQFDYGHFTREGAYWVARKMRL